MRYLHYLLLCTLLGGTAAMGNAAQPQPDTVAAARWQTSWPQFVEIYNACVRDAECHRSQFVDKEVTWEGVVESVDMNKSAVRMDMREPPLMDKDGKGPDVFSFVLNPGPTEIPSWKSVSKGRHVRFRTKITGTDIDPATFGRGIGKTPVYRAVLEGKDSAVFFSSGGELVQVLDASSPRQSTAPPATPVEQPSPSPITEAAAVLDTARALAKRGLVLEIPSTAEAEIEAEIAADQEKFALPFGPSPAVLIRLPGYSAPFTLTISSYPSKGFHKDVFVPIAVFLDEDFKPKHELAETSFKWKSMTFGRQHFESTISIEDAQRDDRYVLIFTNGSRTREVLRSGAVTAVTPYATVSVPSSFARSFWGDVYLEVRPRK